MEKIFTSHSGELRIRQLSDINSIPHIHNDDEIEIMIVISGSVNCVIHGTTYLLKNGDAAIITRFQTHSYYHNTLVNTLSFIFHQNFKRQLYQFFNDHIFKTPIVNIYNDKNNIKPNIDALLCDLNSGLEDEMIYEGHTQIIIKKLINLLVAYNCKQSVFVTKNSFFANCNSKLKQNLNSSDFMVEDCGFTKRGA